MPLRRWDTTPIFDLFADVYAWFTAQPTWRASCAAMAARLPAGEGLRVADLGCGPGVSTIQVARRRPHDRVVGLDFARRMLLEARRRARADGQPANRITWLRADAVALPFRDASLDALTGHSFLYLLPDQPAALAEMRRVLRPGGRLVLMEPHARPATPRQVLGISRDVRHIVSTALWRPFSRLHCRYTTSSLPATLTGAGFVGCQAEEVIGGLGVLGWGDRPAD